MGHEVVDNLEELFAVLPADIREAVEAQRQTEGLIEIVLDLGRRPEARYPGKFVFLREEEVTQETLDYVLERVGHFGTDNRAGIPRTLHRIAGIRNRQGRIIGLTCRIGRAVYGTIEIIDDVIQTGQSLLMLGRPGVGKTTMLREVARVLSDQFNKRVVIVDTSNEIAGDGDIPHPAIGHARRMQVPQAERQAQVMIEAVENHNPEVIVIDEIGTEAEAAAARTIAERGVQLIGTAHGNTLDNLVINPTLSDLIGGIQSVTLGDEEARKRGTQKTVLERMAPPTFDVVIEIQEKDRLAIHHDVGATVDLLLRGVEPDPEIRVRGEGGRVKVVRSPRSWGQIQEEEPRPPEKRPRQEQTIVAEPVQVQSPQVVSVGEHSGIIRVFPYAVSRNRLEKAIAGLRLPVHIAREIRESDMVLTLKGQYRKMPKRIVEAEERGLPVYQIRSNTQVQIEAFLLRLFPESDRRGEALLEAERAIWQVKTEFEPVELSPQPPQLRRLQHQLADRYQVETKSTGEGSQRRVIVFPHGYRGGNGV